MSLGLPRADGVRRGPHAGALAGVRNVRRPVADGHTHEEIVELVDPSVLTVHDHEVAPGRNPEVPC
jgi:hypothetical protein